MDHTRVPGGYEAGSQRPLDTKGVFVNEDDMKDLSSDRPLRWYQNMPCINISDGKKYEWKESDEGLLETGYTYPSGVITDGIDYSNRTFNFVLETSSTGGEQGIEQFTVVLPEGHTLGKHVSGETIGPFTDANHFAKSIGIATIRPTISQNKSVTLTGQSGNLEIGTPINYTLGYNFIRGLIESKNGSPSIFLVGEEIDSNALNFTGPGVNSSTGEINLAATGSVKMEWGLVLTHKEGTGEYFDSDGVSDNNLDAQRAAGTVSDTLSRNAYYYAFFHEGADGSSSTDSSIIRGYDKNFMNHNNALSINKTASAGVSEFSIYTLRDSSITVVQTNGGFDITSGFSTENVSIADGGGAPVNYKKWTLKTGFDNNENLEITIS